jgi:predicted transcriptional regulator
MSNSSIKIPVGVKNLAQFMGMEEVEVRFFPKLNELTAILKDYNFGLFTRQTLVDRLGNLKEDCVESGLDSYADGVGKLMSAVQYRY